MLTSCFADRRVNAEIGCRCPILRAWGSGVKVRVSDRSIASFKPGSYKWSLSGYAARIAKQHGLPNDGQTVASRAAI